MISAIITAYKEAGTIRKAIRTIADANYSGIGQGKIDKDWEVIVIAPDENTRDAAQKEFDELGLEEGKYQILEDSALGKPAALNQCFKVAKGDWLLLTDGDVYLDEFAVKNIVEKVEKAKVKKLGGVTGRPVSADKKDSMFSYWGNLLADAAHHKRTIDLTKNPAGRSTKLVKKRAFFPLSGYLMLVKNLGWQIPNNTLIDDAYISYELFNKGYKLSYEPTAKVYVKYPQNLKDYFRQKKRSTGGYVQLWSYDVIKPETKSRSFWRELEYFWFPITYARNLKQLFWSLFLYPTRLWLWIMIYWERKILKKDFKKTWVRIESTK